MDNANEELELYSFKTGNIFEGTLDSELEI